MDKYITVRIESHYYSEHSSRCCKSYYYPKISTPCKRKEPVASSGSLNKSSKKEHVQQV